MKTLKMMNKTFYYTVELLTQPSPYFSDYDELTGDKIITIYEIIDNIPTELACFDVWNENNSEEEVSVWLDENGYFREEFKLIKL
jgi:hypothetical protein